MKLSTLRNTLLLTLMIPAAATAQETKDKITADLYGFVRSDASIDSRMNASAFEGLFLLYPLDVLPDANGADLNDQGTAGMFSFNSRLGVNVGGLTLWNAKVTGRLEGDFAGFSGSFGANYSVLRVRQAFIKMAWTRSALTVGQTWHPLFGPVFPEVLSISVGAPFHPFNRSPLVRYDYNLGGVQLSAAAIWQFQFASGGPAGKSNIYQRQAGIPELYAGLSYTGGGLTLGAGFDYLTTKLPCTESAGV
jgi:predicted porin